MPLYPVFTNSGQTKFLQKTKDKTKTKDKVFRPSERYTETFISCPLEQIIMKQDHEDRNCEDDHRLKSEVLTWGPKTYQRVPTQTQREHANSSDKQQGWESNLPPFCCGCQFKLEFQREYSKYKSVCNISHFSQAKPLSWTISNNSIKFIAKIDLWCICSTSEQPAAQGFAYSGK